MPHPNTTSLLPPVNGSLIGVFRSINLYVNLTAGDAFKLPELGLWRKNHESLPPEKGRERINRMNYGISALQALTVCLLSMDMSKLWLTFLQVRYWCRNGCFQST